MRPDADRPCECETQSRLQSRFAGWAARIRIQYLVSEELVKRAVEIVGAGFRNDVYYSADGPSHGSVMLVGGNRDLLKLPIQRTCDDESLSVNKANCAGELKFSKNVTSLSGNSTN